MSSQSEHAPRLLLIDGLNLIRRVYAAVPGDEGSQEHGMSVVESCRRSLARALAEVRPSHALCVQDAGGETWRHALHPAYKQQRPPMPPPLSALMPNIAEAFESAGVHSVRADGFEADDVIASIASKMTANGGEVVILSTDKSMLMLLADGVRVRNHFDERYLDRAYVEQRFGVGPEALDVYLALVGDRAQGIPGVRSIGAKTAASLIADHGSLDAILAAAPQMSGRIGNALTAGTDDARLSLALVSLRCDVELGINLNQARVHLDALD